MSIKNLLFAAIAAATSCLITSCWDPEEDQTSRTDYFTITGNNVTGYVLYMDNGGKLIPTSTSVNNMTNGKGFGDYERAIVTYTFKSKDLSEDKNTVNGGELIQARALPVIKPLTTQEAADQNITAADSLFDIVSIKGVWAYRGYLNIVVNGMYAYNEKRTGYLYPGINLVYDETKMMNNSLDVRLCYNKHAKKGAVDAGGQDFTTCMDIRGLENYATGRDTITINLQADGIAKPITLKIAREDFAKSNWR